VTEAITDRLEYSLSMSNEDGEPVPNALDGRSLDDAVDVVVAQDESRSPEEVRQVLAYVAEDGVVSTTAADEAVAHLSKVVSTPETRTELAEIAFADAKEAAEPVDHLDVVTARLDQYETRLDEIQAYVPELGEALQEITAYDGGDLYELAARIQRLTTAANRAQGAADELSVDLEEFERWLSNQTVRYDEFAEEVDALEESIEELTANAEEVAEVLDAATETHITLNRDPVATWFDVSLRHRAVGLLFDDLRAELATLREWPGTEPSDRAPDLAARLDDLRTQWEAAGERLETSRPDERRFTDLLDAFEEDIDAYEPPIDWSEVQETLEEYRERVDDLA
jgi:uncharacterized protein Yka (UPF0111/DUF47 family)